MLFVYAVVPLIASLAVSVLAAPVPSERPWDHAEMAAPIVNLVERAVPPMSVAAKITAGSWSGKAEGKLQVRKHTKGAKPEDPPSNPEVPDHHHKVTPGSKGDAGKHTAPPVPDVDHKVTPGSKGDAEKHTAPAVPNADHKVTPGSKVPDSKAPA